MGRKKKKPTKVISFRISKTEYEYFKALAKQTGKSLAEVYALCKYKGRL